MPAGRPKGIPKSGGRKKGTPNKVTSAAREAFLGVFKRLEPDLEQWIRDIADEPGGKAKASDLVVRMAEYHYPKLARTEVTGKDGGAVFFEFPPIPAP